MKGNIMRIKGRKFDFLVLEKTLPNGVKTKMDLIEHPGAVLVVPFLTGGRVIFLRQYRPSVGRYLWELPAGTMEKGEPPLACARRELIEETGFKAKRVVKLGKIHPVPGYSTEVIYIYKAEGLSEESGVKDEDELIRTKILTRPEARRLFDQGKMTDAKTIAALAFCGWL
jgi:ADP-ribose pyrophosphatase